MNKKQSLFNLSLIIGTAITLSGCFGNTNDDRIVIRVGFWPTNSDRKDVAMYEKWRDAFEEDYPQYKLVGDPYTYSPETVVTKAEAETLPTVFQTWFTEPSSLVSNGYIRACDEQLQSLGWLDKMDDEMRQTLTFDGKVYGVPRDGYGLGLLINKKILGDFGLLPTDASGNYSIFNEDGTPAYPTTFEEIYEISQVISEADDTTKGILLLTANKNGGWQFTNFVWNYGGVIEEEVNGQWRANLTSDATISVLSWIQKMKSEGLLLKNNTIYYDDWHSKIGSQVAMAFVGSDVLQNAKNLGKVDMDNLAFVPMPTGDGVHHYSLYGGTPFVFPYYATDEQVEGALRFLEYCGRSPLASDIQRQAMIDGNEVAIAKNQPILPTIKPWKNAEYLDLANAIEKEYININMPDYEPFFNTISDNKHIEEPYYAQELYKVLDNCIQQVLVNPDTANIRAILTTAEATFNNNYMSKVK